MHVMITDAGALPGFELPKALPHWQGLLRQWQEVSAIGGDPTSPFTPAERVQGQLHGHAASDPLPTAAWLLARHGIDPGPLPWALVTPLHIQLEAHQALALSPEQLRLTEAEAEALWRTLAPLFPAEEGWQVHRLNATTWVLGHLSLADWQAASLDRVSLRTLDAWLPAHRGLRRLQNEIQMLLHEHPVNRAREAQGALTVNSVWISGCGVAQGQPPELVINHWLRSPALQVDTEGWRQAWLRLDEEIVRPLLSEGGLLTLAGETWARTFAPKPRPWWHAWPQRPVTMSAMQQWLQTL
jgi:hypothetical protein